MKSAAGQGLRLTVLRKIIMPVNTIKALEQWLSLWCLYVLCTQRLFVSVEPRSLTLWLLEILEEVHFKHYQSSHFPA